MMYPASSFAATVARMPRVAPIHAESLLEAVHRLRAGQPVAFPTETVYGLGADAFNVEAVERVYVLKGRPTDNPLIIHVADARLAADRVVAAGAWGDRAAALARRFWPGPLTLVLPKRPDLPRQATAGRDTVAVRCPAHSGAQALLGMFGSPIAAPSANRSGHVSPTTAAHVAADFDSVDDLLILDGGPCAVGIESTVVDLTSDPPRLLRPGSITVELLREVIGHVESPRIESQDASPGTAERHYAPRTPAIMMDRAAIERRLAEPGRLVVLAIEGLGVLPVRDATAEGRITTIPMPDAPESYARRLYDALREADTIGAAAILIERPPENPGLWASIHDRLRRATRAEV